MEDNETIEERVVVLDCSCNLGPTGRGDGTGVEKGRKFVECIENMT